METKRSLYPQRGLIKPLKRHRNWGCGFYETPGLGNVWKRECYGQVQCYPMKTRNCKDQEMLASEEEGGCSEVKAENVIYQTRLVRDQKYQAAGPLS